MGPVDRKECYTVRNTSRIVQLSELLIIRLSRIQIIRIQSEKSSSHSNCTRLLTDADAQFSTDFIQQVFFVRYDWTFDIACCSIIYHEEFILFKPRASARVWGGGSQSDRFRLWIVVAIAMHTVSLEIPLQYCISDSFYPRVPRISSSALLCPREIENTVYFFSLLCKFMQ